MSVVIGISKKYLKSQSEPRSLGDQGPQTQHPLGSYVLHFPQRVRRIRKSDREHVDRVVFATGDQYDFSFLLQPSVRPPTYSYNCLYNSGFHSYPLASHTFLIRTKFLPTSLTFISILFDVGLLLLAEVQAVSAPQQTTSSVALHFDHELSETLN